MSNIFLLVPLASLLALVFAWIFFKSMMKNSEVQSCWNCIHYFGRIVDHYGLVWGAKSFCADSLFNRWFFLRVVWVPWNENGNLCFGPYGSWRFAVTEQRASGCIPQWSCHGAGSGRVCPARHCCLVLDSELGYFHSGTYVERASFLRFDLCS